MTPGEAMKFSREKAGLSIKELAEISGIAAPLIGRYERDITIPSLTTVELIADALNISIDEYVGHVSCGVAPKNKDVMSPKQKEWAYRQWCIGYPFAEIAEALGLATKTVQKALKHRPRVRPTLIYDED